MLPVQRERTRRCGAYAPARRGDEAGALQVALAEALDGQGDDRAVILNDTPPQAATTQLLYGLPGSELLTSAFDRPDNGGLSRMWNLALLPRPAVTTPTTN